MPSRKQKPNKPGTAGPARGPGSLRSLCKQMTAFFFLCCLWPAAHITAENGFACYERAEPEALTVLRDLQNREILPETVEPVHFYSRIEGFSVTDEDTLFFAWQDNPDQEASDEEGQEEGYQEEPLVTMTDPLEPVNRLFFALNDKLYFWFLKPITRGYEKITPKKVRSGLRNFFYNLAFPIRFVNCLLQFKGEGAAMEFSRFIVNSTVGLGGFMDVATEGCHYKSYPEDFGQTLRFYGFGHGFYINWPVLGPSSLGDTIGNVGDSFFDPVKYAKITSRQRMGTRGLKGINEATFLLGEYETLKEMALDPYVALRDAYYQHRLKKAQE